MAHELAPRESALAALEQSLTRGGLLDLARTADRNSMLAIDVSGSMGAVLATGLRAIDELRKVATVLRETHPVPMLAFGLTGQHSVSMVETIPEPGGDTPLAKAITFAKAQNANHLVVISDGMPESQSAALAAARAFGGPIDVFYVGDPGDPGELFLRQLAEATGGNCSYTDLAQDPKLLAGKIAGLLGDGKPVSDGTIIL